MFIHHGDEHVAMHLQPMPPTLTLPHSSQTSDVTPKTEAPVKWFMWQWR